MNNKLITIALLAAFSSGIQAGDLYYKWVDERGITHYSQNPPDDNGKTKIEVINVSTRIPMGSDEAISKLEQQRSSAVKKTDEDSKEGVRKTGAQASASTNGKYKEQCERLRKDAQALEEKGGRIKVDDGKGGIHTMTEEERQERIADTQKQIKAFCE